AAAQSTGLSLSLRVINIGKIICALSTSTPNWASAGSRVSRSPLAGPISCALKICLSLDSTLPCADEDEPQPDSSIARAPMTTTSPPTERVRVRNRINHYLLHV